MLIKNTKNRYGEVAVFFHWIIAILIIGLLSLGLYMASLSTSPFQLKLFGWHKEWGLVVLALAFMRILWRFNNVTPLMSSHLPNWQKLAANSMHWALYIFMFAMPLTGWLMSSAAGFPPSFFGLFTLPNLIAPNKILDSLFGEIHEYLGYALIAAIVIHIAATVQHYLFYKENILRRILP